MQRAHKQRPQIGYKSCDVSAADSLLHPSFLSILQFGLWPSRQPSNPIYRIRVLCAWLLVSCTVRHSRHEDLRHSFHHRRRSRYGCQRAERRRRTSRQFLITIWPWPGLPATWFSHKGQHYPQTCVLTPSGEGLMWTSGGRRRRHLCLSDTLYANWQRLTDKCQHCREESEEPRPFATSTARLTPANHNPIFFWLNQFHLLNCLLDKVCLNQLCNAQNVSQLLIYVDLMRWIFDTSSGSIKESERKERTKWGDTILVKFIALVYITFFLC